MVEIALIWWPPNGFDPPIVLNMDWNSAFGPKFMIKIVAMTSIWWPSNGFAQTHEIQLSPKLILSLELLNMCYVLQQCGFRLCFYPCYRFQRLALDALSNACT
jgi:hypothetical protein